MDRMDFDIMNEAFRAGNRARKKESVQDSVESVDSIQAQIDLFKKQTDTELEIKDGHPYYNRDLYLGDCTEELTILPEGLEVKGHLNLEDCTGLTSLPAGLKVNGELNLAGCTGLTSLPADLEVGGGLILEYCTGLTSLPAGLKIGGGLNLEGCTRLTSLPAGLKIRGGLNLEGCTGLTHLPDGLEVRGNLTLYDCTGLTSLPDGLKARGGLDLCGCTGLTSLPADLKVGRELCLARCTGLTSLPDGLEVGGDLNVGDTGLTGLPFDLVVNPDYLIVHYGTLTPFFNKLGIPCENNNRQTKASDWREWQRAHGYLTEAFRAGNRARKKESAGDAAADMHNPLQDQIDRFREQTGIRLEIKDGRPYYKGNGIEYSGNPDIPDNLFVEGDFSVSIWQERLPAGLTVTGMLDLGDCKKLTELPPNITACDLKLTHSGIKKVPKDTNITGSFIIYGEDDQDLDRFFREDCGLQPLTVNAGPKYRPEFENRIIGFSWNRWRTVGKPDFDKIHNILTANEAFRAGNRARKKESVQDAVESVDSLEEQVRKFEKVTGAKLEIKQGIPLGSWLNLKDCKELTRLPDGLTVFGNMNLAGCTGLKSLPDGLTVYGYLNLNRCTGLTSLPRGMYITGSLRLSNCDGITELPADLKIEIKDIQSNSIYDVPDSLKPFLNRLDIAIDTHGNIAAEDWMKHRHLIGKTNEAFRAGNRARKKEAVADTVSVGLTPEQQVKLFMADVMKYREWLIQQGNDVRDDTVNPGKDNEVPVGVYYEDGIDDVFRIEPDGTVVIRSIVDFTDYPYEIHFPEKVQCNALVNLINCDGLTHLPDNMYVEDHLNLERCKNLRRLPQNLHVGFDLYLNGCTALEEIPDSLYIGWGDLDLENCPKIRSLSVNMTLKDGRILFSENSPLHKFFDDEDISYAIRKAGVKTTYDSKWGECSFNDWNAYAAWVKGGRKTVNEAFRAGNNARKKESAQDTVEGVGGKYPVAIDGPAELIKRLMEFLDGLGYEKTLNRLEMTPHKQQNGVLKYYGNINERYPSLGGNYIKISLGRHPMWNERRCKFCNTGLTLEIEANEDRMFYRIQYLPADKDTEDSVQFLNCLSDQFDAWEKPDGTRWGKPRNREALDNKDIPAVWPNMFKNIAEASDDPTLVFVPDPVYSRCWKFEKPSAVREAFRAGNRARRKETVQDTVQTTGEYRPVTRELLKDVVDSFVNPTEGPISGLTYRRYDQHMTGQSLVNYLNRILELCGYKDMLKAEVVFKDDTCDGVQITDDKNRSVSRMVVQYNRDYVCVLTGSMDTGMPGLLYAYRNLPDVLEIHLEGIDSLNADLREYIDKFG